MRQFLRSVRILFLLMLFIASIQLSLAPVQAAELTAGCAGTTGNIAELEVAITTANNSSEDDVITLVAGCTYTLTSTLIVNGGGSLTINGNRAEISGNNAFKAFDIASNGNLSLNRVTIRSSDSTTNGGAILNAGRLMVFNSTLTQNTTTLDGGAIYNAANAQLTIDNSVISNNSANQYGGAIANSGTLNITYSILSGNQAALDGGGIYNATDAEMEANGVDIFQNTAAVSGGGIYNNGTMTVSGFLGDHDLQTLNTGNTASERGAAIYNDTDGVATLTYIDIWGNTLTGSDPSHGGGAIYNIGNVTLGPASVVTNGVTTNGSGGGILNVGSIIITDTVLAGNGAIGTDTQGGGMLNLNTTTIERTSFYNNNADRGAGLSSGNSINTGNATLRNVTFSGNNASAEGGAIYAASGTITVVHSTFADNTATVNGNIIYTETGNNPNVQIEASILEGTANGVNCYPTTELSFLTQGNNISNDGTCVFTNTTDLWQSPSIQNEGTFNGGFGLTYTPLAGSPAIDRVTGTCAVDKDHRGIDRPQGGGCDVGAIEVVSGNAPPTGRPDFFSTPQDTPITLTAFTLLSNDSDSDGDTMVAFMTDYPSDGEFWINPDGTFNYRPDPGFIGTDTFTYTVQDKVSSSEPITVTITIALNTSPTPAPESYIVSQGQTLTVGPANGLLQNDTDAESDPLTARLTQSPTKGTLTLSADGTFTYLPNNGAVGVDTFRYQANDGKADSAPTAVTITIYPIPVANNDTYATGYNTPLIVNAATGVLLNDTDAGANPLTAELLTQPDRGTLIFNADGSFTYTPGITLLGEDTFTYRVFNGVNLSSEATVTINVATTSPVPNGFENLSRYGTIDTIPLEPIFYFTHRLTDEDTQVPGAWYGLSLEGDANNSTPFSKQWWYPAEEICIGFSCLIMPEFTADDVIMNGTYYWRVMAWHPESDIDLSDELSFELEFPAPEKPVGFTVSVNQGRPSLTWDFTGNTAWYLIYVADENNVRLYNWYSIYDVECDSNQCNLTPDFHPLNGNYRYYIAAWGPGSAPTDGEGIWSDRFDLTINLPPAGDITPLTTTNIHSGRPTFTWRGAENATWYQLWIGTPSPNFEGYYLGWHSALDAGCPNLGNCTVEPPVVLDNNRAYTYYVQSWGPGGSSEGGVSGWTVGRNFTVNQNDVPTVSTLVNPQGTIRTGSPTYTWIHQQTVSWYQIQIESADDDELLYEGWHAVEEAGCRDNGLCELTLPDIVLPTGTYRWRIQAYNPAGLGSFSVPVTFTFSFS